MLPVFISKTTCAWVLESSKTLEVFASLAKKKNCKTIQAHAIIKTSSRTTVSTDIHHAIVLHQLVLLPAFVLRQSKGGCCYGQCY